MEVRTEKLNEKQFSIGDAVVIMNADEIEECSGRDIRKDCCWHHEKATELCGHHGVITDKDHAEYREHKRDIYEIEIVLDSGKVESIWCHPEWLEFEQLFSESDELEKFFNSFNM